MTPSGDAPEERQEPDPVLSEDAGEESGELQGAGAEAFERFLEQRDLGEGSVLDLLEGTDGDPDMQDRVNLLGALEQLSELLAGAPEGELPELERLGRFDDLRIIGEGGLSRVFAGYDPRLAREVALKVLSPGGIDVAGARDWMLSEGRSLAKLEHPCVVEVFEVDEADGFPYIAMERVDGPTLQEVLDHLRGHSDREAGEVFDRAQGLQTMAQRLRLALDLAEAIAECHKQGVVHRDVKPGNVLLPPSGRPKLIDFGLAHLEDAEGSLGLTQRLVGTPGYVAPEQVDEERTGSSPLSDQFSFAVVLYELITLVHPFRLETKDETMRAVSRALPEPPRKILPATPVDIERIVLHALSREAHHRYPSMDLLADDLRAFLDYRAISLRAPSPLRRARLWVQRNDRAVLASALTLAVLAVVFTAFAAIQTRHQVTNWTRRLAKATKDVSTLQEPADFLDALNANNSLRRQARELDGNLLRSWAHPLEGQVAPLDKATTERIREQLIPERKVQNNVLWLERIHHQYSVDQRWAKVLSLEESFFGRPHLNDDLRDVGVVQAPEGTQFFRYVQESRGLSRLNNVTLTDRPRPGVYRARIPKPGGGAAETEFVVTGFEPRKDIELPNEMPSILERMQPVKGRTIDPERIGDYLTTYDVADFSILPDAITWLEYEARMDTKARSQCRSMVKQRIFKVGEEVLDDNQRAVLTIEEAARFAEDVGCRLATPIEAALAIEQGLVDLPDSEYLASLHPAPVSDPSYLNFKMGILRAFLPSQGVWTDPGWLATDKPGDARSIDTHFRLVRSGDLDR